MLSSDPLFPFITSLYCSFCNEQTYTQSDILFHIIFGSMINCKNCIAFFIYLFFISFEKWVSWSTWPSNHHHHHHQQYIEIQWKIFTNNQMEKGLFWNEPSAAIYTKTTRRRAENDLCQNNDHDIATVDDWKKLPLLTAITCGAFFFFFRGLLWWQKKNGFWVSISNTSVNNDNALKLRTRLTIDSFVWSTFICIERWCWWWWWLLWFEKSIVNN